MDSAIVCSIYIIVISLCLSSVDIVTCQGSCSDDSDCSGKFPCCSKFGYCGAGEGYCTDPEEEVVETIEPVTNANDTGCYMPNIEIIGGDLPRNVGGGGLELDPGQQVEDCQERCRLNPLCLWFTFVPEKRLCYLKSSRGYLRYRTSVNTVQRAGVGGGVANVFISGATFSDGCNEDPPCLPPYYPHRHQCLYLPDDPLPISSARALCDQVAGELVTNYLGYLPPRYTDDLYWMDFVEEDNQCLACTLSPSHIQITSVSCNLSLRFACERRSLYTRVIPPRPTPVPSLEFTGSNSVDLEPIIHFQKIKKCQFGICRDSRLSIKSFIHQRQFRRKHRKNLKFYNPFFLF